jgi:hypothetical protein
VEEGGGEKVRRVIACAARLLDCNANSSATGCYQNAVRRRTGEAAS